MLDKNSFYETTEEGLPCLKSNILAKQPDIEHFFTTRKGGVSSCEYESLNLSFARSDNPENVKENFARVAAALHCKPEDIVSTAQTHTDNILIVTRSDGGKGITRPADYTDVDALITNCRGLALSVFTADCIPILFFDKEKKVIASAHCGWRGTAAGLQKKVVETMEKEFGCNPEHVLVAMGPGICRDCYEVSEDVAEVFKEISENTKNILKDSDTKLLYDMDKMVIPGKQTGKYYVDLWLANALQLCQAGVLPESISISGLCTNENSDWLFSHRATQGKRGNLGGFIKLR